MIRSKKSRIVLETVLLTVLYIVCMLVLSTTARAQTVTTAITLGWVPPTQNTDGSKITGTLTYAVYQGAASGSFSQIATGLTATTELVTSTAAGNCFAVATIETIGSSSTESALSSTTCAEVPGPPTNLTITVTVSVH